MIREWNEIIFDLIWKISMTTVEDIEEYEEFAGNEMNNLLGF